MSRSGYSDDNENFAMWRGVIASATRGKRGQRFFRDLVTALDAMPEKALITGHLETEDGAVCALGALGLYKGADMADLETTDYEALGATFDIAEQLARETIYENDEGGWSPRETPEARWTRVRAWAAKQIRSAKPEGEPTTVVKR